MWNSLRSFYKKYPDAKGKKILLWAPTFRKNAAEAGITGLNEMEWLEKQLGGEWMVLKKDHFVNIEYRFD